MENLAQEKMKVALEKECGFPILTILTVISIGWSIFNFLYNCNQTKGMLRNAAKRNGLACRIFMKNKVMPDLIKAGLTEEEALKAAECLRQHVADGILEDEEAIKGFV